MDILTKIGNFAVENYDNPVEEVKKLGQKERYYLDVALNHLAGKKVKKIDDEKAEKVFKVIKLIKKEETRDPAKLTRKFAKKVKELTGKRIGFRKLADKILELKQKHEKKDTESSEEEFVYRKQFSEGESSEEEFIKRSDFHKK